MLCTASGEGKGDKTDRLGHEILGEQKELLTFVEGFFIFKLLHYFLGTYCLSSALLTDA